MMREIKFRAWDKEKGFWLNPEYFYITGEGRGFTCEHSEGMYSARYEYMGTARYVIEQFTGRHDKNGKGIWEGDICKWNNRISKKEYQGSIWSIVWDKVHTKFTAEYKSGGKSSDSIFPLFTETDLKVIGNIHESPKLLKENYDK